jgi:hypothetical protein
MKRTSWIRSWIICGSTMIVTLGLMAAGTSASAQQAPRLVRASTGAAPAATQPAPRTKAQWQADIRHLKQPGSGCYRASYPAVVWHATRCARAPRAPMAPRPLPRSARHAVRAEVGNGTDYSAQVSGTISRATGTFTDVTPGLTEQGKVLNTGVTAANAFTLQLNSQYFTGSPACDGGSSSCEAWQQFLYAYENSTTSEVFMQYWVLDYGPSCPSGFTMYPAGSDNCYSNSSAADVSTLTASQLASVALTASASPGGDDAVTLALGSEATSVTRADGVLDLAENWNTTEWGVYGDAFGNEAIFSSGTTLQAQTALTSTDYAAPGCVLEGFTGETNNLNLTSTPALVSGASPTIATRQTNGSTVSPSCATAVGALPPPTPYEVAFQSSSGDLWTVGASDTNWGLPVMAGTSPSITTLSGGGYEVAFQATSGDLWTVGSGGETNWDLGMMAGTSPAITGLSNGGYEVAFQANTGSLWTVGSSAHGAWNLGMMAGTSPAITALSGGGYEAAFQANTGALWSAGTAGTADWTLGMAAGTSPDITTLSNGTYEMVFQANTGTLWSRDSTGANGINWTLGMMAGTSPGVSPLSGGFEMDFQAGPPGQGGTNGQLWSRYSSGDTWINWTLGMLAGTSPSISTQSDGSYVMAIHASDGNLWTRTSTGINGIDWGLAVAPGTSPSITG